MPDLHPEILFEDTHLIVLSKPAGMLSQGEKKGDPNVVDWLRKYLGRNYVGLVHRLDRNTSGILLVAKRTKSAARLTASLQDGKIYRAYAGWVEGTLDRPVRWNHKLWKDEKKNKVSVVSSSHPKGKEAILRATPMGFGKWQGRPVTLLEFVLDTGRSHQIRVQTSYEGFPLLGDRKYGNPKSDFPRPALHSYKIRFPHPMNNETLEIEDSLPADMAQIEINSTAQR